MYFLDKKDYLAERAGDREDRYYKLSLKREMKQRRMEMINLLLSLIEFTINDKIEDIIKEKRQKVLDSQLEALEKEITTYDEAIQKFKELVVK